LGQLVAADAHNLYEKPLKKEADPVGFFNRCIYDCWPFFQALDLGDFRQEWNSPRWYVIYIALHTQEGSPLTRAIEREIGEAQDNDNQIDDKKERRFTRRSFEKSDGDDLRRRKEVKDFLDVFDRVAQACKPAIDRARKAFGEVEMHAFKEARDLLESLRHTGAFYLYILSEGDPKTQRSKLERTGLDKFFDAQYVLTTGDAAEPVEERKGLIAEKARLEAAAVDIRDDQKKHDERVRDIGRLEDRVRSIMDNVSAREHGGSDDHRRNAKDTDQVAGVFQKEREAWSAEGAKLYQKQRLIDRQWGVLEFAKLVLDRMAYKGGRSFYAAAIRAVLRNPHAALDKLKSFTELVEGGDPKATLKFAMVGDRPDNDINPVVELLGSKFVLTFRFESAAHYEKSPGANPPMFAIQTLAQSKALLLSKKTWNMVDCAGDPDVFGWKILTEDRDEEYLPKKPDEDPAKVGVALILEGCQMDTRLYPTIRKICSGILAENFSTDIFDMRETVLAPYLQKGEDYLSEDNRRRRIRLLSAVAQGAISWKTSGEKLLDRLLGRLFEDLADIMKFSKDFDQDVHVVIDTLACLEKKGPESVKAAAADYLSKAKSTWRGDPRIRMELRQLELQQLELQQ